MKSFSASFRGKRILVTGHTGFKGAWLSQWLLQLGAEITGVALTPAVPSLFRELGLEQKIHHLEADIRDPGVFSELTQRFEPDFVFHLAAQPLVRYSYKKPAETWQTNVFGTVHLLEALRRVERPCAAVFVTTDKVYENREWNYGYRENDALGGYDPYSSSKAAMEMSIESWRRSFFSGGHPVRIASARAGNVIGGGDWAEDRILPDAIRALADSRPIPVRNAQATRPWQHVLEPLSGYLTLASQLAENESENTGSDGHPLCTSFNFGPRVNSNRTVAELIGEVLRHWPGSWAKQDVSGAVHEAKFLHLATDKAYHLLGWEPVWDFSETISRTVRWYKRQNAGEKAAQLVEEDLAAYVSTRDHEQAQTPSQGFSS